MINAINLRCEYLTNPSGIDIASPRLMWNVSEAKKQTKAELAYRISGGQWIKEAAVHDDSMNMIFPGKLSSRDLVEWKLRLTDEQGNCGEWSPIASFEMGLLEKSDWSAKWITGNYEHSTKSGDRYPTDHFKKSFKGFKVKKARLYITACGMYEAFINGNRVGEWVLAPGSTAFQKKVHYQTYDVTDLVSEDENVLEIELADGFFASKTGCFEHEKVYGYEPKLLAQLEITDIYEKVSIISSDETFLWSNDGPLRFADLMAGETVDFRMQPSFCGQARLTGYDGIVCASNSVPIKEQEVFINPKLIICPDGNKVLDFGQNIAGYIEFSICGRPGETASIVLGEKLDETGNFTVKNISPKGEYTESKFQRIDFTCDGIRHVYKTKFAIMGFQYALLLDWPEDIVTDNFKAIAVYSDMSITGNFKSSSNEFNRIVENTLWSMKGNFLDVPTDCPTRERAGWTGDAQLFFNTGNYLMDQAAFFRKWLCDVEDCQKDNGMVYNINPSNSDGNSLIEWASMEGAIGWGDAFIMIPYRYLKRYGDDRLIKKHWSSMKKCFSFYQGRLGKRNIFTLAGYDYGAHNKYLSGCGRDFGEWTEPADCAPSKLSLIAPHPEESTAYIAYDAMLMAEMAEYIGDEAAFEEYGSLAKGITETYQHYFVNQLKVKPVKRMAKLVRPVALGLVDFADRKHLLEKIVELNKARNYKVGTGFLSTPFVLELLTEAGDIEGAYKMLTNHDFGWMQQIDAGATTIWENWTNDASLNHYSKGACCQWLFDCVCGIKLDGRKNHFVIEPHVIPEVDSVSFSYASVYGTVVSSWKKENKTVYYQIVVPGNCEAELKLPHRQALHLYQGSHRFEL